jgi:hypothetical protein
MTLKVHLALDSGAHSVYERFLKPKTGGGIAGENVSVQADIFSKMDLSFYHGPQYKKYVDKYVAYVKEHTEALDFYVTLDIIFNPKLSWESTLYLESCGIKPMPVFHYGEDHSWFKKYLDRYEYIGVGGLGQTVTKHKYIDFANKTFAMVCNSRGVPQVRLHGFAMGAFDLMLKFPWHSVDATSPFFHARMGAIVIPAPILKHGKLVDWNFFSPFKPFAVTERRRFANRSIEQLPPEIKKVFDQYLDHIGYTMEDLQEYTNRDITNLYFFLEAARHINESRREVFGEEYPLKFYVSGKPSGAAAGVGITDVITGLDRLGIENLHYLGTFFIPATTNYMLKHNIHTGDTNHGNKRPRIRPQTRAALPIRR